MKRVDRGVGHERFPAIAQGNPSRPQGKQNQAKENPSLAHRNQSPAQRKQNSLSLFFKGLSWNLGQAPRLRRP
jgi:hypothetical protein